MEFIAKKRVIKKLFSSTKINPLSCRLFLVWLAPLSIQMTTSEKLVDRNTYHKCRLNFIFNGWFTSIRGQRQGSA